MNYQSDHWMVRTFSGILSLLLLVLACNFPLFGIEEARQPPTTQESGGQEQADQGEEAIDLTRLLSEAGDTLLWVDGSLLVYIPPGKFIMGHDDDNNDNDDNPEHTVYVDGFWIYRTEVTNRMYLQCMVMGACPPPQADNPEDPSVADLPVTSIRWEQAQTFCEFVGGHLPSEAQWEKTARGADGNMYPWGNAEPNCELLNFNGCVGKTSSVIEYPPGASPYEVLDMAGNVFEWVADWYQANYYEEAPFENPPGPGSGEERSVRGSTFESGPNQVASALRFFLNPDEYRSDLGFRCVVENAQDFAPPCEILPQAHPEAEGGPGTGPGGSTACVVPQPEISVVTYCNKKVRGNNISWTPADAAIDYAALNGASCSQYDADTLACAGDPGATVEIEACKSCPPPTVDLGVPGSCDPPYVLDETAGLCRYDGDPVPGRDRCTPGFSPLGLPDNVCCERQEGNPHDFPVCPPGGTYEPASRICWFSLPSTGDKKCASQTVYFEECGGDTDDYCSPENLVCYDFGNQTVCYCVE